MITLSGKDRSARAYALIVPPLPGGEAPERTLFGFAPRLARTVLAWKGWQPDARTEDEIDAMVQALLDPAIDVFGYRLIEAQHRVWQEIVWTVDLDDLAVYYDGPDTDDEYAVREWLDARRVPDLGALHTLFDCYVPYDRDLADPSLVEQIRRQIDEEG